MLHLFVVTIPCQQMTNHSLQISDSVYVIPLLLKKIEYGKLDILWYEWNFRYESNWYILPVRSQKLLLMLMRRTSKPFEFVVGKIYTYSMENLMMVFMKKWYIISLYMDSDIYKYVLIDESFFKVIKASFSYFTVLLSLNWQF